jgi:hypothetical protein
MSALSVPHRVLKLLKRLWTGFPSCGSRTAPVLLELLELLLEEELLEELEELDVPPQLAACGLLPVTVMLSIFARPLAVVACNRMLLTPAFRFAVTRELLDAVVPQFVQAPVAANARGETTVEPFTSSMALRSPEALA